MQNWNIPTDKVQKVDEKNGVICLITKFTPKNVKNGSCFVFSAHDSKKLVEDRAKYLHASETLWIMGF